MLLPQSEGSSPPTYQASAYPGRRKEPEPDHGKWSFITAMCFMVSVAVLVLWGGLNVSADRQIKASNQGALARELLHFQDAIMQCEAMNTVLSRPDSRSRTSNPRWAATHGQNKTVVLRNARLFDGETFLSDLVDITFSNGLIKSVTDAAAQLVHEEDATEFDVHGRYVTPGLVDMHSHHLSGVWPATKSTEDGNEINPATKALTPMVRVLDSLKPYDPATELILSGGITSSLIIPGSANLIGGEGITVKNVLYSGEHGEPVVEDLLLERGIPANQRRRYMKMAFGENPKEVWEYTRMGNSWHLREHLQKAKDMREKQDDYCSAIAGNRDLSNSFKTGFVQRSGKFPFDLALESTIALLRGQVILQNHNYEPEDIETMLRISKEFGFRVSGFHHATEAWQIPKMLKERAGNITIATFAEFSLYKWEAFAPSLYAGHILDKNDVAVAYKSDHVAEFTNAKYLASQAAIGHSFLLPEDKALQAITSVPAKAIDLDYRIGYCRPGYDADIVVWDSHPLSIGATPLQVFVDGQAQLDQEMVEESMGANFTSPSTGEASSDVQPHMRYEPEELLRKDICSKVKHSRDIVITGIRRAFVDKYPHFGASASEMADEPLQLVIESGRIICLGSSKQCAQPTDRVKAIVESVHISLKDGSVFPGLTAITGSLGMREIAGLDSTGDGEPKGQKISDPESVVYAKHGVWLDGKQFARARLGGVTKAISPPIADASGMVHGVSVEILTSGKKSLLNGGIVQGDVALHIALDENSKTSEDSISNAVGHIRKMLKDGKGKNNATIYGKVASGSLPLVVACNNKVTPSEPIGCGCNF